MDLEQYPSSELMPIANYIQCHHERWDGNGYSHGLSKETIPLLSRIISIVDSYNPMTSNRPYKKVKTRQEAVEEMKKMQDNSLI